MKLILTVFCSAFIVYASTVYAAETNGAANQGKQIGPSHQVTVKKQTLVPVPDDTDAKAPEPTDMKMKKEKEKHKEDMEDLKKIEK